MGGVRGRAIHWDESCAGSPGHCAVGLVCAADLEDVNDPTNV